MDFEKILIACLIVGGVGLLIGVLLGIASKFLSVKVDEKVEKVRAALPGNNCGGCGYPGCDGLAAAIACGDAEPNGCPVGGPEVAKAIGEIMGKTVDAVKMVAHVHCSGTCDKTSKKFEYSGVMSCKDAALVANGDKSCEYGCLGLGSCVSACEYGGIKIVNGVAYIEPKKCKRCGKCVQTSPRGLIKLVPFDVDYTVDCLSKDKGIDVRALCKTGCIGCKICEKNCPTYACTVTDNVASIDASKCVSCGVCASSCPQKVIKKLDNE